MLPYGGSDISLTVTTPYSFLEFMLADDGGQAR